MKTLAIIVLAFIFVDVPFSQPLCDFRGVDSLTVQFSGDTTSVWDLSLCAYCSAEFAVSVSASNDSIFIAQTDTAGKIATCDCLFDQRTSIVGLSPGEYWIVVRRELLKKYGYPSDLIQFVGAAHVQRPPISGRGQMATADSGVFKWNAFQSGCLPDLVTEDIPTLPNQFALLPNFPNPFNPSTIIGYQVPSAEYVQIKVYDILGREIRTLVADRKPPGQYAIPFDPGVKASSGIYYCRMVAGSFSMTRRLILLR